MIISELKPLTQSRLVKASALLVLKQNHPHRSGESGGERVVSNHQCNDGADYDDCAIAGKAAPGSAIRLRAATMSQL